MMKKINTLVEDIYGVFDGPVDVDEKWLEEYARNFVRMLVDRITEQRGKTTLRLSNIGKPCFRQLWYSVHSPQLGEKLSGPTRIKFLIGDITEWAVLLLARLAGHVVAFEQQTVSIDGVEGHIDATIDGEVVDVKSASPFSFDKFVLGLSRETDAFGYIPQLNAYSKAKGKSHGYFLPVHKVLGKLHLDRHEFPDDGTLERRIADAKECLGNSSPPPRAFTDEDDGKSGNRALGVACSYCAFKETCWPGLITIPYANGPRYLTKMVKAPVLRGKK